MALEAPYSKYRKTNFKLLILICIIGGIVFAYDGYFSKYEWSKRQSFYEKYTKDGKPSDTMLFNQKFPFLLGAVAIVAVILFIKAKDNKVLAEESDLSIDNKVKISYDAIQKIDKTHFDTKGFFVITYKDGSDKQVDFKISNKKYDNLKPVLEHVVAKIS